MLSDSLKDVCENQYFAGNLRINSALTKAQYRFALNDFRTFIRREPVIDDLKKPALIGFLRWLIDVRNLASKTANERTGRIRALWSWLAEEGMIDRLPPRNIRVPEPEKIPTAWTVEELRLLYAAAGQMPGQVNGNSAGLWWQTLLMWLWNTGARHGETMALEWSMINTNGTAVIPGAKRKGGLKTAYYCLWPSTLEALQMFVRTSDKVFDWRNDRGTYYHHWSAMLKLAGLPDGRNRKTQSMRVSHATWLAAMGGDATKDLMHSSGSTTVKHYLDRRIISQAVNLFPLAGIPAAPPTSSSP